MGRTPDSATRVLLLEDNPGDVRLVCKHLEAIPDLSYAVTHVEHCAAAVDMLRKATLDIVLVDLNLPDTHGIATVNQLRPASAGVPLVVLTEIDDEEFARDCIAAGAHDYLRKAEIGPVTLRRAIGLAVLRTRETRIRETRIRELEHTLSRYREMSSAAIPTPVTQSLASAAPVKDRAPADFDTLRNEYVELFAGYLRQLIVEASKPQVTMNRIASRLGDLGGSPRDLIDLHVSALDSVVSGQNSTRVQACVVDGRLLALEMMGLLVDYYRTGISRSGFEEDDGGTGRSS
ncbi:MAG: response regulator [Proteobacteria bacterium]|nr:response regulator [Pseudomonadota bacterium]